MICTTCAYSETDINSDPCEACLKHGNATGELFILWEEGVIRRHKNIVERLDYLRREIQEERISYAELAELQQLAPYIEPGDTLLLEWAGGAE